MSNQSRNVYGSFIIGDMEVAISAMSLQEVVNEPPEYKKMPLAPPYLIGLFNLRGIVVPVVDLRNIFTINDSAPVDDRKVAIIEYGDYCVGVLFDNTGEVFNGNEEQRTDFTQEEDSDRSRVINGVFKLGVEKRIVHILDPYELLNLDKIPHSQNLSRTNKRNKHFGKRKQCISFYINEALCAVEIQAIQEIVKIQKIENTALSSELCLGAINLRGLTIPVINIDYILECTSNNSIDHTKTIDSRIMIMRFNEYLFGLLVHSVESIISFFEDELIKFPPISTQKEQLFLGCITKEEEIETILLDYQKILSNKEIQTITKGHKELYQAESDADIKNKHLKDNSKSTYITFSIGNLYALKISEVREIIDQPHSLITPPNLSEHFSGMFNLRGELVTIINTQYLDKIQQDIEPTDKKVIIFSHNNIKYGLTVDSINSIVSFEEKDALKLPDSIFKAQSSNNLLENFGEAIQITNADNSQTTLLVLKVGSLIAKITLETAA